MMSVQDSIWVLILLVVTVAVYYMERIQKIISGTIEKRRLDQMISKLPPSNQKEEESIQVSALYIHPVKSLRPVSLSSTQVTNLGLEGDRTVMVVRPTESITNGKQYRFLTQRQCPKLATINASFSNKNTIKLSDCQNKTKITIDVTPAALSAIKQRYKAGLWDEQVEVVDLGDAVATFVQSLIQSSEDRYDDVRVVAQLPHPQRRVNPNYCPAAAFDRLGRVPQVSLTDGFPILLASEESLDELNRRLKSNGKPEIPMSRFRPNIVVKGLVKAFGEDYWKAIQIGGDQGPILHVVKGCPRCKQSCTDQVTGERLDDEPLETLSEFRAFHNREDVYFAQNVVLQPGSSGTKQIISVGDSVRVLTRGSPVWDMEEVSAE